METQVKQRRKKRQVVQLTECEIADAVGMVVKRILMNKGILKRTPETRTKKPIEWKKKSQPQIPTDFFHGL